MQKYEKGVPFDPGYSQYYVDFYINVAPFIEKLSKIKVIPQKKFRLNSAQPQIIAILKKSTAFYLGCLLWAAYISYRFKDEPKEILNNHNLGSEVTAEESNIGEYLDEKVEFLKKLDKDYQYFLKKSLNIDNKIFDIIESYKEFALLNNNFISTRITSEVKLPERLNYFSEFSTDELDQMEQKIVEVIKLGKLELLLDTNFYR